MAQAEERRRWATPYELYHAAEATLQQRRYGACAGLAYDACFQAMWVALGDPPAGEWRHGRITRRFCHGQWASLPIVTTHLATLHKRLRALYELRLDTHYRARPVHPQQARQALQTVRDVIRLVQRHTWHRMEEA